MALGVLCAAGVAWCDDPAPADVAGSETGDEPVVVESKLETFYVPDKDGNMVPFFKTFPFEKLEQLYRLQKRFEQPEKPDRFSIPRLISTAKQEGESLQIDFKVQVRTHSGDWVRAPLKLVGCALIEPPKINGPGEYYLNVAKDGEGFDLWVKAPENSVISVDLRTMIPLEVRGSVYTMKLSLPTAASSQLTLAPGDAPIEILQLEGGVSSRTSKNGAEFIGLGGEFRLQYSLRQDAPRVDLPTLIESSAEIRVLYEGSHHIRTDAKLRVHGLSGSLESFLVRLPAGMNWVPRDAQPGRSLYSIERLTADEFKAAKLPARFREEDMVKVQLARRTSEPIAIEIRAVVDREKTPEASLVEAAGFEVVGASQQWGMIDLAVNDEWNVETTAAGVQRVDQIPAKLRTQGVSARYEFSSQPCSLKVRVLPRPTRISVEPAYTLSVQEDLVTLEARFGYNIRGASELKVDMKGWTVVSVQPDTAVEIDQLNLDSTSPLLIPLTPLTQQEKRNLPIIVTATMPIAADGGFSLSLPMPVATTISPALVAIQPASDVLLELAAAQMSGLTAEPIPANGANPVADAALLFRTRGQFGAATIAGKVARRDRKITVTQDVSVDVTVASINVNQQFFIQIDHQSTREIVLLVPTSVVQSGDLELTHGVQDLSWKAGEVDPADDQVTPVIVDLQGDRRGDFPLLASWRSPAKLTPNHDGAASELQLGLIRLSEDSVDRDDGVRLTLFLEASMRVSDIADGWNVAETAGVFVAARERSPAEITLQITRSETVGAADVIVQRAWLQTWYSAGRRRDRAVFRVKTARNSLSIRVGERFQSESLQAAVDGVRLDSVLQLESGVHVIPLVSFTPDDSHTIELWYGVDDGGFNWGRVQASPPIIEDASPTQRFYWQLATPAGSQLTFAPSDMDDELGWDWRQLYFQRASALNQSDLENWSHASKQQDLPKSANQYVFSTFGAPEAITARVMNRWLLAAIAAITALAVGFAVFSLSFFRRPVILLAGAAVLAVAATAAPGFAMVAGQWAFWGIAALVVVRLVDWTLLRRKTGRSATVVVQPAESIDSTYAQREDSESGVDYSTATAPHLRHAASSPNG